MDIAVLRLRAKRANLREEVGGGGELHRGWRGVCGWGVGAARGVVGQEEPGWVVLCWVCCGRQDVCGVCV